MEETAAFFAGERNVGRQHVDLSYANWFSDIWSKIAQLDYKHSTISGRLIQNIVQALDDIEVYEPIENNIQIRDFIIKTKEHLNHMIRAVNVKK